MTPPHGSEPDSPFPRSLAADMWLHAQASETTHKEALDRLGGDKNLYDALKNARFTGPDWDFVAQELARYGLAVIGKWVRTGVIVQKCRERNVRGVADLPTWVRRDEHLCDALTNEVVADAITKYQTEVLEKDKWNPAKGASLRTFFIGQCLFRYPTVFRRLIDRQHREATTDDSKFLDDMAVLRSPIAPVENDAINSVLARDALKKASSPRAAMALAMSALNYDYATIAHHVGGTVDGIKGLLKRERDRIRNSEEEKGTA